MSRSRAIALAGGAALLLLGAAQPAGAMHIAEGILPAGHAALWFAVAAPFVAWGTWCIHRRNARDPRFKPLVALVGAAVFIVSCMPIPVPTAGTCSHPCGTGLAAILIGPGPTVVVGSIALVLQALFMAHGGLTTLGANVVSMAVVGALTGYAVFRVLRAAHAPVLMAAFAAGMISDWATYATTASTLALGLHGDAGFTKMLVGILVAFVPTQLPMGVFEGFLSAGAYKFILARRPELLTPTASKRGGAS